MILGDFLIDDRLKNGADQFSGKFIHFGQTPFDNWGKILEFFNREI
jgi:hypothetical protein